MPSTATIAEIAARAGVGTATVDRVLNKRPGVNADTVQRVMQAVAEIGTPPQRGRPRRDANFRFAFVLPADAVAVPGARRPADRAVGRRLPPPARHRGHLPPRRRRRRRSSPPGWRRWPSCEGVALMAPDLPPVKLAINELVRSGVHVVTLFSDVAGSMRETHVGADSRAAGRTAGLLLARMASGRPRDTLLLASQATRLSAEIERRIGFAQVLEERFPDAAMLRLPDLPAGDAAPRRALAALPEEGRRSGADRRPLQRGLRQRRAGPRARRPAWPAGGHGRARPDRRAPLAAQRRQLRLCADAGHPLLRRRRGARAARPVRERSRSTQRGAAAGGDPDRREPALKGRSDVCP